MGAVRISSAAVLLALVVLLAVFAAGCGRSASDPTPVACLDTASAYLAALEGAPAHVRLSGDTPISDCLAENQQEGELATVGEALVGAATALDAEARAEPGGSANLQLGYLVGAAQQGADGTNGIHTELLRRLTVAARYAPGREPLPPAFYRVYRTGYAAGKRSG
jgi:hypothetical protein